MQSRVFINKEINVLYLFYFTFLAVMFNSKLFLNVINDSINNILIVNISIRI